MRHLLASTALALLAACGAQSPAPAPSAAERQITAPAEDTRIIAVVSYASWCSSCRALDPKIDAVFGANTFDGVERFTLDFTDRDEDAFFANAETLGIFDTLDAEFSEHITTGKMYLIDRATGTILARIDKSMDEREIKSAIAAAAA